MSPSTVSENGVVGQATSFELALTGETPYTYTQTFGNICTVSINGDTATVTITPTEIGILTGSITFNEEATCDITIDVQAGITVTPNTVSDTATYNQQKQLQFVLEGAESYTMTNTFGNDAEVSVTYTSLLNNQTRATVRITPKTSGTLTGSITFNDVATANITLTVPMYVNLYQTENTIPTIGVDVKASLTGFATETVTNATSNDFDSVSFSYQGNYLYVEVGNVNKTSITGSITFTGANGSTYTKEYTVKGAAILELVSGSYSYTGKLNLLYPCLISELPNTLSLRATTDLTTTPATVVSVLANQIETSDSISDTLTLTDNSSNTFDIDYEIKAESGYMTIYPEISDSLSTATLPVTGSISGTLTNVKARINSILTSGISLPISLTFTDLLQESDIQTNPQYLMFNNAYAGINSDQEYVSTFYLDPKQCGDISNSKYDTYLVGDGTYIDYSGSSNNIVNQDTKVRIETEYQSGYYEEPNLITMATSNPLCWYNTFTVYQDVSLEPSANGHQWNIENLPSNVYTPPIEKQIVYTNIPKYMCYDEGYQSGGTVEVEFGYDEDPSDNFTANAGYLTNGIYRITSTGSDTSTTKRCYSVFAGGYLDSIPKSAITYDYPNTKVWYDITCNHGSARIMDGHTGTPFDINGTALNDTVFGEGYSMGELYIEYTPAQTNEPIQIDIKTYIGENNPFSWKVTPNTVTQTEANQRCYTNIKNNGITIDYNNIHNSDLILNYVRNNATGVIVARGGVDNSASNVTTHNTAMLVRQGNSTGNIDFMAYTNELPNGEYSVKFTYTDSNSDTHELYITFVMAIPEPPPQGYSLTPTTVSDSVTGGEDKDFTLTLAVGSDFTSADIDSVGGQYGGVSTSESEMTSAGTFTVNYTANEIDVIDEFTVTATCHRTGGLDDIVLTTTFTIECVG